MNGYKSVGLIQIVELKADMSFIYLQMKLSAKKVSDN